MKNKLSMVSNVMLCILIIYFVFMVIDDVRFICSNTGNMTGSLSIGMENAIYIFSRLLPFLVFLAISALFHRKCRIKGITTLYSIIVGFIKIHRWIAIAVVAIGLAVVLFNVLYFAQNRLLYYPNFDIEAHTTLANSNDDKYEEISIQTSDGILCGWGYHYSDEKPTILYFGGNAQSSANFIATIPKSLGQEYNWVMIDYPGYGVSSGVLEYDNILKSAEYAYNFVANNQFYGQNEIFVTGFSLGTGVAVYVASKFNVDKLILIAPYDNGINLYNSYINVFYGPFKFLVRNPFPSSDYARQVKCPVLIIASEDDEVIPYELAVKLKNSFSNVQMITYTRLRHNEIFHDSQVEEDILKFL